MGVTKGAQVAGMMVLTALAASGCGAVGGASFLLKSPVADRCESTGLKGCPELTEGVLLVVEGKRGRGLEKIADGASKNSPEEIRSFAGSLETVMSLPGVGEYAEPLRVVVARLGEIAETLPPEAAEAVAATEEAAPGTAGPSVASGSTSSSPPPAPADGGSRHQVTAETDAGQLHTERTTPSLDPTTGKCGKLSSEAEASCARPVHGPLVITDLVPSRTDCELFIASADVMGGAAKWRLDVAKQHAGVRLFVNGGDALYVGTIAPSPNCSLLWSGFVPYGDAGDTGDVRPVPSGI